ncbi:hypothetical protein ACH3O9_12695 [Leeuwenhoekiella sp. A16]|uniref:hypothetical protein n=1 Tax=unclassified Leeuwenhoekiella TaxID=2615029 RepID=UPI003A7FC8CD
MNSFIKLKLVFCFLLIYLITASFGRKYNVKSSENLYQKYKKKSVERLLESISHSQEKMLSVSV